MNWEPVVGLEIHVHLKTKTKMFCRCAVGALDEPNTRTCPICLAHPGVLPVPNSKAIEWMMRCPNPHEEDGDLEIRQMFEMEDFGESSAVEHHKANEAELAKKK